MNIKSNEKNIMKNAKKESLFYFIIIILCLISIVILKSFVKDLNISIQTIFDIAISLTLSFSLSYSIYNNIRIKQIKNEFNNKNEFDKDISYKDKDILTVKIPGSIVDISHRIKENINYWHEQGWILKQIITEASFDNYNENTGSEEFKNNSAGVVLIFINPSGGKNIPAFVRNEKPLLT